MEKLYKFLKYCGECSEGYSILPRKFIFYSVFAVVFPLLFIPFIIKSIFYLENRDAEDKIIKEWLKKRNKK